MKFRKGCEKELLVLNFLIKESKGFWRAKKIGELESFPGRFVPIMEYMI